MSSAMDRVCVVDALWVMSIEARAPLQSREGFAARG